MTRHQQSGRTLQQQRTAMSAPDVLVHALPALGIGGLLGGLAMTWWQRRHSAVVTD